MLFLLIYFVYSLFFFRISGQTIGMMLMHLRLGIGMAMERPGVGRILPMPLLAPWAWEATFAACLLFPLAGMWADQRRTGRVHRAWFAGLAATFAVLIVTEAITYSPAGLALYKAVAAGSPGASIPPLAFPPPPGPPPAAG